MPFERVKAEGRPFRPDGRSPEVGVDGEGSEEGEGGGCYTGGDEDLAEGDAAIPKEEEGVCGEEDGEFRAEYDTGEGEE